MPGQMTNYMENKLADFMRGQGLTLPTNWFFALGSAADDGSFTELSGTGYARQALLRSTSNFDNTQKDGTTAASSGTSHISANSVAVSFGDPGGAWGTANVVGLFDASSGGNCWVQAPISPIVITTGSPNPVSVLAGKLKLQLGASGGCTDYLANKLLDLVLRAIAFTWPSTLYLSLFSVEPNNAGIGGTEFSAGAYARVALVPSLSSLCGTQAAGSTAASSGTGGEISNNATLTFPAPTADQGTANAGGVHDAATMGNLLFHGPLDEPLTVNSGGTAPSYAPATFTLTLS